MARLILLCAVLTKETASLILDRNAKDNGALFVSDNASVFGAAFEPKGDRPHIIIGVGMPKCGSTFMFDVLNLHNDTVRSRKKETVYFNTWMKNQCKNASFPWVQDSCKIPSSCTKAEIYMKTCYKEPWQPGTALIEFSPGYMTHERQTKKAALAIKELGPEVDIRLITVVREPVSRAIAEINMFRNLGTVKGSDSELSNLMASRIDTDDYSVGVGHYATQIQEWLDVFPKSQLLIVNSKALGSVDTWKRIYSHLGLKNPEDISKVLKEAGAFHAPEEGYLSLSKDAKLKLDLHYQAHNDRLWKQLDVAPWW